MVDTCRSPICRLHPSRQPIGIIQPEFSLQFFGKIQFCDPTAESPDFQAPSPHEQHEVFFEQPVQKQPFFLPHHEIKNGRHEPQSSNLEEPGKSAGLNRFTHYQQSRQNPTPNETAPLWPARQAGRQSPKQRWVFQPPTRIQQTRTFHVAEQTQQQRRHIGSSIR